MPPKLTIERCAETMLKSLSAAFFALVLHGCSGAPTPVVASTKEPDVAAPAPPAPTAITSPSPRPQTLAEAQRACLKPLAKPVEPVACPEGAPAAACAFHQGSELFRERDYPAAAARFIPLSLQQDGDLGRSAGVNVLVVIPQLAQDVERRDSCLTLYRSLAPRVIARQCPLLKTAQLEDCHELHRVFFQVEFGLMHALMSESTDGVQLRASATEMRELFDQYCTPDGPFNNPRHTPLDNRCDEVLSAAHTLFVRLDDQSAAAAIRERFRDPSNRLADSEWAADFAEPGTKSSPPPE